METNNNANSSKSRKVIFGAIAGIVVAGALGAAFMLGGQAGSSNRQSADQGASQASPTAQTTGTSVAGTSGGVQQTGNAAATSNGSQDGQGDGAQAPDEALATDTPAAENDDAEPTDTPTATPTATPWGPDDLAAEPTATATPNPCPFCNDLEIAVPLDLIPQIENISTSFCYPTMAVFFDLSYADSVWFSFTSNGVTHESQHIDADTFPGFLTKDMGYLAWGVYLISNLRVHAQDDQGNHVWSDQIDIPEPDLGC